MARESSGRVIGSFALALGVGFIVGTASWWLPARAGKHPEHAPAPTAKVIPAADSRRAQKAPPAPMRWVQVETTAAMKGVERFDAARAPALKAAGGAMYVELGKNEGQWDRALASGARVWGVAPGDGFVMVHADNDSEDVAPALSRGDFYSSTGVRLSRVEIRNGRLEIDVAPESAGEHQFMFIGRGGEFLGDMHGRSGLFNLAFAPAGYIRAVVIDADGRKAWTQPLAIQGL